MLYRRQLEFLEVFRMDMFLHQCTGRFKVNWDMTFITDPPEFLRCSCDFLVSSSLSALDL